MFNQQIIFLKKNFDKTEVKILTLVILVGFILRVYNLPNLFYYTMDEEVMNLIQRRIILGEHFPLIGSVSPLGTYLGPIFYYFGALILLVSKLNPIGQSYFAAILGVFNIFLIYFVAKKLFNTRTGLLAALFYSTSFLMVIFDRRFWHLTPGPILSLLVLLSIFKIKHGSIKYVYLLTAALIFGWNTDYTNLILFLFTVVSWVIFKLPLFKKEILIALLIFGISNAPLVLFDLRHDFLNSKAFISYFTNKEQRHTPDRDQLGRGRGEQTYLTAILPLITFSRALFVNSDLNISEQHTYCKQYILDRNLKQGVILPILSLFIILSFSYLTFKYRKKQIFFSYQIILLFYLIFQLGVLFYAAVFKGDVFEHYLATLLPYLFIILSVVVWFIFNSRFKYLAIAFVLIFIFFNLKLNFQVSNTLSLNNKISAAKFALNSVGSENFSLDSLSCFKFDGFYYPFLLFDRHPIKSHQDPNYSWLYNYEVAEKHPKKIVVMVPRGKFEDQEFKETYHRYQKWVIDRAEFGDLEVLILDNSQGEFH